MGLIKGGLLFLVSFLLMISLLGGNLFLTLALSLETNDFRSELLPDLVEIDGDEINLTKEVEENFYLLEEHCENNTNFVFNQGGYVIDIPCEVVEQGPDAAFQEGIDDAVEGAIEEAYPNSSFGGYIKTLFLLDDASDSWKSYFYVALFISFILIVVMFFLIEEKLNILVSVGFLILISSLPLIVINFLLSLFENTFLKPISLLFSEAYTVFLIVFTTGIILMVLGFGLKFFKFGWTLSERFGKIKNLFSKNKGVKKTEFKS